MAYLTAITVTVSFDTSLGGRAFLGEGQSIEAFRLGTLRAKRRATPFRVRAVLAPVTMKFPSENGVVPKEAITFTCAPNSGGIEDVSPQRIEKAHRDGVDRSFGESAVLKSVQLSDPGGLITIQSGSTPGLLAIDGDRGTPFYTRDGVSVDTYHRLVYRDMASGKPEFRMVDELELPSFWMRDPTGNYVTFNLHSLEEERVSRLDLPVSLMKADEFMDVSDAEAWSEQVHDYLLDTLPRPRMDVIFGYASLGAFAGKTTLQKAENCGLSGCVPVTQLVSSEAPYLHQLMRPTNQRAMTHILGGFSLEPGLL